MKPSASIKPISYLKTHTADVVRDVNENRETIIITQNGAAKAIVQDIATYEQTQETLALLKLLAQDRSMFFYSVKTWSGREFLPQKSRPTAKE